MSTAADAARAMQRLSAASRWGGKTNAEKRAAMSALAKMRWAKAKHKYMKLYRLTVGKRTAAGSRHDWYSGQLEHLAKYGDLKEAKSHLTAGKPDGVAEWPEVYDDAGHRLKLEGRRLVRLDH